MNDEAMEVLKELLVWTRVGFYAAVKTTLVDVLNNDKKRLAYQAADGVRSGDSIRVEFKMSPNDVSELFKQCTNLGLMEQLEGGKRRRLFDLTNFGLIPAPAKEYKR
jgi:adenylate cyclase class IV